jgi:hypothetical protein
LGGSGGHSTACCTAAVASSSSRVSSRMPAVNPDAAGCCTTFPDLVRATAGLVCQYFHPSYTVLLRARPGTGC